MKKSKVTPNWSDAATTTENEVLPRWLKWAWTSRGMSLAINVILIAQITYYCTDMLGMSATLVGALLLASKVFDGITDLLAGVLIDRTHTRMGKARPYQICIVFVWLFTVFLFSTPAKFGMLAKSIYVIAMYTAVNSIFATLLNCGDAVHLSRSVRSEKNRVSVLSFNGSITMIVSIVITMILPQLINSLGTTRRGWTTIALMMAVPFGIIGSFRFFFVKEVVTADASKQGEAGNKVPVRESIGCIFRNRYIWILSGMTFLVQMISGINSSVNTYYFKYIMGNIGLASIVAMSSLVTPIVLVFFPVLTRKFGTVKLLRIGAILEIAGYAIRTIGGANMLTLMVGTILTTIAVLPVTMMISIYVADCMDYGEWKTGIRVEGMIGSVNSFMNKIGNGVASGVVGIIMGMAGYDGSLAVQSAAANASIVTLFNVVPLVFAVIMLILAIAYNLDKKLPEIRRTLAEKKGR